MKILNVRGYDILLDDEDYERIAMYKWQLSSLGLKRHGNIYFHRTINRKIDGINTHKDITLHRQVFGEVPPGLTIDHIDGNQCNNQKANLRLATRAENKWNTRVRSDSGTGVKGVFRVKNGFIARISVHGVRHNLGTYPTIDEAKEAYREASIKYHGQYARTN